MSASHTLQDACTETMARFSMPDPQPHDLPIERRRWAAGHDKYRSIIEGRCPECGGLLERRARCGWCGPCSAGWVYQGSPIAEREAAS